MPIATVVSDLTQAEVFPLIRGGGLFLLIVGLSIVVGAFRYRARYVIFGLGAGVASVLTALFAARLAAPFGNPDMIQIGSLVAAVALEIALLSSLLRPRRFYDDRGTMLSILTIVGGHFVLMAPAFGPLAVLLAGASVVNTLIALLWRGYANQFVWAIDGLLKVAAGVAMFYGHMLPCAVCLTWRSA